MATQAQRTETTRAAVIKAAYAAFEREGSPDVSLEHIAREAGVTKGSIHYHFDNRTGLLAEVATWVFQRFEGRVATAAQERGKAINAKSYARALLHEQTKPVGRLLFTIGDELQRAGRLSEADPYPYLCSRLEELGASGSIMATAAALVHYGRQLAFGQVSVDQVDVMVDSLGL